MKITKHKILLLIPLLIINGYLVYTWQNILFTNYMATWRHYVALILFIGLVILFITDFKKAVLATGIYLILGVCNLLTLTPSITTDAYGIRIGSFNISTPHFQVLSFVIFVLFFILNFDTLVDIRLDYLEEKEKKRNL